MSGRTWASNAVVEGLLKGASKTSPTFPRRLSRRSSVRSKTMACEATSLRTRRASGSNGLPVFDARGGPV